MKTDKDRPIDEVISSLEQDLKNFGFTNPTIYPASARQGLWSKLIQQNLAPKSL
ncbi:hypothetical protein [Moorena sp. SIOASIH]|uniref:hypothetical protein n=1 Tax=Moorena sp. SIOASIH TaxID=2607817 RepID=UPI0025D1C62D|nr:hypothetical protein [Moorena sp. SIOASIH]